MTIVILVLGAVLALDAQRTAALNILVLEGEGAVNIIQQKTAVRPLVEVRDRNNLPVAGATVTFSITGGGHGASFAGGVQTLTVTTNAAGQAAASSINALSSGAFQIQVQAMYQGQIATAAISQTNFATVAAAAQAGSGAGSGGTATGATGGAAGGGGVSATALGIAGAAAVGGGVLATQAINTVAADEVGSGTGQTPDTYNGTLNAQMVVTNLSTNSQGQINTCLRTFVVIGTMTIQLNQGGAAGKARMHVTRNELSISGPCIPSMSTSPSFSLDDASVSGGPSALTFTGTSQSSGNGTTTTNTVRFTGALVGGTISGTVNIEVAQQGSAVTPDASGTGSTTLQVTLQK
jgi:hypothetical protein